MLEDVPGTPSRRVSPVRRQELFLNVITSAVALDVGDVAASSRFFTAHLGFREDVAGDDFVALSRTDAATDIVLIRREAETPAQRILARGPSGVVVYFAVTGIAEEYARLVAEGANITMPLRQEPWGEWQMQVTDPNGVVVQLWEWVPPAGA
jgi:predicted enzyme related to lactoylglutathione lyase